MKNTQTFDFGPWTVTSTKGTILNADTIERYVVPAVEKLIKACHVREKFLLNFDKYQFHVEFFSFKFLQAKNSTVTSRQIASRLNSDCTYSSPK